MEIHEHIPDAVRHAARTLTRGPCIMPAQLPVPLQAEHELRTVESLLAAFVEHAASTDVHIALLQTLGGAHSALTRAIAEQDTGAIAQILNLLSADLFVSEPAILSGCKTKVHAIYQDLLKATEAAKSFFVAETYTISLVGSSDDLDGVQLSLLSALSQLIEQHQATLAEAYGWARGKTTCCPEMGYNPPAPSTLQPVHDPKAHLELLLDFQQNAQREDHSDMIPDRNGSPTAGDV